MHICDEDTEQDISFVAHVVFSLYFLVALASRILVGAGRRAGMPAGFGPRQPENERAARLRGLALNRLSIVSYR